MIKLKFSYKANFVIGSAYKHVYGREMVLRPGNLIEISPISFMFAVCYQQESFDAMALGYTVANCR
jgi:hypothetical protein